MRDEEMKAAIEKRTKIDKELEVQGRAWAWSRMVCCARHNIWTKSSSVIISSIVQPVCELAELLHS